MPVTVTTMAIVDGQRLMLYQRGDGQRTYVIEGDGMLSPAAATTIAREILKMEGWSVGRLVKLS